MNEREIRARDSVSRVGVPLTTDWLSGTGRGYPNPAATEALQLYRFVPGLTPPPPSPSDRTAGKATLPCAAPVWTATTWRVWRAPASASCGCSGDGTGCCVSSRSTSPRGGTARRAYSGPRWPAGCRTDAGGGPCGLDWVKLWEQGITESAVYWGGARWFFHRTCSNQVVTHLPRSKYLNLLFFFNGAR